MNERLFYQENTSYCLLIGRQIEVIISFLENKLHIYSALRVNPVHRQKWDWLKAFMSRIDGSEVYGGLF